jgi:hypothetical protein
VAADWIPTFLRSLWSDSRALMSIFSLMVVTPIVTIYLLINWKRLIATIERLIPAAAAVLALTGELNDTISGFLRRQGTICLVLAFYYALALWLVGLNHGIPIALPPVSLVSFPISARSRGLCCRSVRSCSSSGRDVDSSRAGHFSHRANCSVRTRRRPLCLAGRRLWMRACGSWSSHTDRQTARRMMS